MFVQEVRTNTSFKRSKMSRTQRGMIPPCMAGIMLKQEIRYTFKKKKCTNFNFDKYLEYIELHLQ